MQGASFGRYSLLQVVGHGGMGEVWKAHDSATDRVVAVKVLNQQFANDDVFQQRFHREARAAAGLNDPHVVPIHGYGEVDGLLYVEMRLIEGRGLDEILLDGPLVPERAVHIVEQTASALDAAHRIGLVHRDVKPSNILVTADDFAYLIDFGIARAVDEVGLTQTGGAIGTWVYMAPERIRSNAVDARSDVYALACVLHECLTGARPFNGSSFEELASAHLWVPPPAPSKIRDTVPVGFDVVIAGGMAKELDQRYSTVREFASAARIALDVNAHITAPVGSSTSMAPDTALSGIEVLAGTITGDLAEAVLATGDSPRSFPWPPANDPDRAPYRGWQPFEPCDAGIFFGRDVQIVRAVKAVREMREAKNESWFVILGPSGSGKSAFMRAGLLPRLQRDDDYLVLPIVRPERDAIDGETGLASAIYAARQEFSLTEPTLEEIKAACADDAGRVREMLTELQHAAAGRTDTEGIPTLVLPLDQAEELLAAESGAQTHNFLQLITEVAKPSGSKSLDLVVAATIRTDRFEALQTRPELADAAMRLFGELKPMPSERFREVILGPATAPSDVKRQLAVSADLVEQLLEDCREGADTLPLLSLTLARLYEDFGASKVLTLTQYQRMGGLQQVVRSEINQVLSPDPVQRDRQLGALRVAFIPWLATISAHTDQPLRRVARYRDLPETSRPLIDALVARRLLIKDVRDGDVVVEVALESLLRQWDELADWLRIERNNLKAADDLERASATWESAGRDQAWLLTGSRLVEAETLVGTAGFFERLHGTSAFVNTSRHVENHRLYLQDQQRQRELHAAQERQATAEAHAATLRKRSRVLRSVLAVAVVIAMVAAGLGIFSVFQRQTAVEQRNAALASRLNTEANAILARTQPGGDTLAFQKLLAARTLAPPDDGALLHALAQRTSTSKIIDTAAPLQSVAISPDGLTLATGGEGNAVQLWDADSGEAMSDPLEGHTDKVLSVAFSPDGRRIASAGYDSSVRIWDVDTGQAIGNPKTVHTGSVENVVFSPDGRRLASAGEDSVRFWDPRSGEVVGEPLIGHTTSVRAVAFSPNGRQLASGGGDNTVRLWDVDTGRPIGQPLVGHSDSVSSVAFSPDGSRIASAGVDQTVRLWDVSTGEQIGEPLTGHTNSVASVTFSPNGKILATASYDNTIRLWNSLTGQPLGDAIAGHTDAIGAVAFSPDGRHVATASHDGTARLWNIGTTLAGHEDSVLAVVYSPDGQRLATVSADATARLWDADTGEPVGAPLAGHTGAVWGVAFSPSGERLATSGVDATVRLWNVDTGKAIQILRGHTDAVWGVAFSPDGRRLASASNDGTVRLWSTASGKALKILLHDAPAHNVTFSPDGQRLASSGDDGVRLWDLDTGNQIDELQSEDFYTDVAFNFDGDRLATSNTNTDIQLWDAGAGEVIGSPLRGHSDLVYTAVFSPDGHRLVSASRDSTIRLWNVDTGRPIGEPLTGHTGWVYDVAFSPNGQRVASAGDDFTVRLWDIDAAPQKLCAKLSTNMSHEQWREQISSDHSYVTLCPDLPVSPDD